MSSRGPLSRLMSALHRPIYESRLRVLVDAITPHLREGDRVLDVGCGVGTLGRALMDGPACPPDVQVDGLERFRRGGEPIPVTQYNGVTIPFEDQSHDVVIVADVLHHEEQPDRLLSECARVARRLLIVKDHIVQGPLAQQRIAFMDWAANAPYGVECLYRYNTPAEWTAVAQRHGFEVVEERSAMDLYPFGWNLVFGRRLQYFAALRPRAEGPANAARA